jgi:hypothetical protein
MLDKHEVPGSNPGWPTSRKPRKPGGCGVFRCSGSLSFGASNFAKGRQKPPKAEGVGIRTGVRNGGEGARLGSKIVAKEFVACSALYVVLRSSLEYNMWRLTRGKTTVQIRRLDFIATCVAGIAGLPNLARSSPQDAFAGGLPCQP